MKAIFSLGLVLAIFGLLGAACPAQEPKKNVLFIMADDLNCGLSCYGDPQAKTPNLDKLAERGVRFERAYCQYPLCNPSRASYMTGRRPTSTKVVDNAVHFRKALPDVATIPQYFAKHVYFNARVGKIYHYGNPGQIGTPGLDDAPSWKVAINPKGRDKTDESKVTNHTPKAGLGASMSFMMADGEDSEQTDGLVTAEAIKLMTEHKTGHKEEPFFLCVGYYRPHCPYIATKPHFDAFPREQLKLPPFDKSDWDDLPRAALTSMEPHRGVTNEQALECLQAYYAAINFVDSEVGKLLAGLENLGLAENTVVVFISDHGYTTGEHGQWMKMLLFEEVARVPLIVSAPWQKEKGKSTKAIVELVDLYPTLVDLCGLPAAEGVEGRSLRPVLEDAEVKWEHAAFTQARVGRSIRTDKYRFTVWAGNNGGEELYDHDADPKELTNLAKNPEKQGLIAELRKQLETKLPPGSNRPNATR